MNPFVELEFHSSPTTLAELLSLAATKGRSISAVIQGFDTWENAIELNRQVRASESSLAFYSVNSSGLYGFAYADLGSSLTYQYTVKGPDTDPNNSMETATVVDSQSLQDFLTVF